jgi:hypothetical protein
MTYTEQYNQYVQEWIKENPAFSGPYYEDMLEFDEWVDKKMYNEEDILDAWELGAKEGLPLTREKKEELFEQLKKK